MGGLTAILDSLASRNWHQHQFLLSGTATRTTPMHQMSRLMGAAIVAVAFTYVLGTATAQTAANQIKLTDKQVEGFIAAQKKMAAAKAEIAAVAKAHGFASLEEYDDVEINIQLVMEGIDPQSKSFTEPPVLIKKRIDEVKAEKSMSETDRKQALEELNDALKTAQPIQYPANIALIKKHYDKIEAALK